ncbi:MAG: hypothetical protein WCF49_02265, partial [Xanthobacteraceae bacterium]
MRQIDAVVVANLGPVERGLHHAGIPARDIEEAEGLRENLAERLPQDRADLTLRQAIAFDQLAVGPPLLLELR